MGIFSTEDKTIKELVDIVSRQLGIIDRLLLKIEKCDCCNKPKIKSLKANYYTVSDSGDIIFHQSIKNKMGQTIQVLASQNSVPGQLIGLADDGVTQEPLSGLVAGSEVYTTSDATIATVSPVAGGAEGQFTVDRVPGASGSVQINYSATRASDNTVVNGPAGGDTFVFAGQPTGQIASLSAAYGTPQAKKK